MALFNDGRDAAVVASWWNDDIGPWNFDLSFKDRQFNSGIAIYTDRPIYRPGQTVYFKGIVRNDDDGRYSLPGGPMPVSVADPTGHTIYSATLALSPFGTFAGEYTLPDYAPLGTYFVNCKCGPNNANGAGFDVQEYRKPEYLVDVSTDKPSYVNGEQIAVTAGATYFFGGPVAGAKITTRALAQDYYFTWTDPDTGASYDFQDPQPADNRSAAFHGEKRSETESVAGPDGQVTLSLPADVSADPMSRLETIEVERAGQLEPVGEQQHGSDRA